MEDIADILAIEVKKEMADRYFGFRKRIERDSAAYSDRITISAIEIENAIGTDLIKIYLMLRKIDLVRSFITLSGLPADFYLEPYVLESPTIRKKIFAGSTLRGFTARQRFLNLFYDTYKELTKAIDDYRKTLDELQEEHQVIREEINTFYRNNDIDSIMGFIRRLDSTDTETLGLMQTGRESTMHCTLSEKLRLHPPLPAEQLLPTIDPLPSFATIKPELKQLAEKAFRHNDDLDLKALCRKVI